MSVTPTPPRDRRRLRGRLAIGAALAALLGGALFTGPDASEIPYDPDSAGPQGLRGLVELLDGAGVQVDVSLDPPGDMSTIAFVPVDRLAGRRDAWLAWVERGGDLVVADPGSPLHGLPAVAGGLVDAVGVTTRTPECSALAAVRAVTHAEWNRFEVPPTAASACFTLDEKQAWLVTQERGAGSVTALGSGAPFTNRLLDLDDHAVLAAALLGPAPGDRLRIVPRAPVGAGETALLDLVPPRVWHGLAVLAVAVVVGALAVGRRFGDPAQERLPPVLPASELALSTAHLLQSAGRPEAAAQRLRDDARRVVARACGQPPGTAPERLAAVAAARLGLDHTVVTTALIDGPVADGSALLAVQAAVRQVRARATGAQA